MAEVDAERIRRLAEEILDALGDAEDGNDSGSGASSKRRSKAELQAAVSEGVGFLTTAELADHLEMSQAWVTLHVADFPGVFRLSEGQRANYRFPCEGVKEYINDRRPARRK